MAKQFEFPRLPVGFDIFVGHFPAESNGSSRSLQVPGFPATPGSRQEQQAQMRLQHEQQPLADRGCGEFHQRAWIKNTPLWDYAQRSPKGCLLGWLMWFILALPHHFQFPVIFSVNPALF